MLPDHYLILGVTPDATEEEIRLAWRRQVRYWHPDRNPDPHAARRIQILNHAYDVLSDPVQRSSYDLARSRDDVVDDDPGVEYWQADAHESYETAPTPRHASPNGDAQAAPVPALLDRLDPLIGEANALLSQPAGPAADAVDRWARAATALLEQRLGWWHTYTQHLRMALQRGDPHMRLAKAQNVLSSVRRDGLAGNIRPDTLQAP